MYFEQIFKDDKFIGKRNHLVYPEQVPNVYREEAILNGHVDIIKNFNADGTEEKRNIADETLNRLYCITASDPEWYYSFKLHSFSELNPVYKWAKENNWHVICTERNTYYQILEYAISRETGIWAFFDCTAEDIAPKLPKKQSITMSKELFDNFIKRILFYREIKDTFLNKIVINYSDLEKISSIWDIYDILNLNDWQKYINTTTLIKKLPVKIPFGDLESYFININDINKWYDEWKIVYPSL
jgi:hypothetical protein